MPPLLGGLAVMFGDLPPLPTTARFSFKGDVQNIQRGMVPVSAVVLTRSRHGCTSPTAARRV